MKFRFNSILFLVAALWVAACQNRQANVFNPSEPVPQVPVQQGGTTVSCDLAVIPAAVSVALDNQGEFAPFTVRLAIQSDGPAVVKEVLENTGKQFDRLTPLSNELISNSLVDVRIKELGEHTFSARIESGLQTAQCEATLNVNATPIPTATLVVFSANQTGASEITDQVPFNGSMAISWLGTNVQSCNVYKNGAATSLPALPNGLTGLFETGPLTENSSYEVKCTGPSGEISAVANITVSDPPDVSLSADWPQKPAPLPAGGGTVTLSWTSNNTSSCSLRQGGTLINSENPTTVVVTQSTSFTVACLDEVPNTVSDTLVVPVAAPTPTLSISASPSSVSYNGSTNVSWNASHVESCEVLRSDSNGTSQVASGVSGNLSQSQLSNTTQYTLSCDDNALSETITVSVASPGDHIVFISSASVRGNLSHGLGSGSGLARADSLCTALAVGAGLRPDRPWKAILSSSTANARDRLELNGPIRTTANQFIANAGGLWSGSLPTPISYTESGSHLSEEDVVWTGSDSSGNYRSGNCQNWTSASGSINGWVGSSDDKDADWISDEQKKCDKQMHLYCISQ